MAVPTANRPIRIQDPGTQGPDSEKQVSLRGSQLRAVLQRQAAWCVPTSALRPDPVGRLAWRESHVESERGKLSR